MINTVETVLTVDGIETLRSFSLTFYKFSLVATFLTVHGIETRMNHQSR